MRSPVASTDSRTKNPGVKDSGVKDSRAADSKAADSGRSRCPGRCFAWVLLVTLGSTVLAGLIALVLIGNLVGFSTDSGESSEGTIAHSAMLSSSTQQMSGQQDGSQLSGDILVDEEVAAKTLASSCPLIPAEGRETGYRMNSLGRGWTFVTDENDEAIVAGLLAQLEEAGYELLEAQTLDLFGEAWGCVATQPETSEVALVIVQPEIIGIPAEDTPATVSIAIIDVASQS